MNDTAKIYIERAQNDEFRGFVYSQDLPPEIRTALKYVGFDSALDLCGNYEVEVEDDENRQAHVILTHLTIENGNIEHDVDLKTATFIDISDIEAGIDKCMTWSSFWCKREEKLADGKVEFVSKSRDRADWLCDSFRDSQAERGEK